MKSAVSLAPLLWLILVLALVPVVLLLLKKSGLADRLGAGAGAGRGGLHLQGSLVLGPGQRVVALEVGHGDAKRCLLLGVTGQQITLLERLPAWAAVNPPAAEAAGSRQASAGAASNPATFQALLARALPRRSGSASARSGDGAAS
ncbi:MAG: hypothetical protein RL722_2799 [Pseudomonadota bacterium]|jgi:flagellar protein FliO/FliZ